MADTTRQPDDRETRFESFDPIQEVPVIHAPIVGYEIVEARKRFTVYQISVQLGNEKRWHVFRRYSDFIRMDERLRKMFDDVYCVLPPKRYFGDNFDPGFIEMRKNGLQEYINNVLIRQDTLRSQPVAEFLCFDDPPGPYDSLEESRAFIESLEDTVNEMRSKQNELKAEIRMVKSQLRQAWAQKQALMIALRSERVLNGKPSHDDNDSQLMSEYSRLPEVANLDLSSFSRSYLRPDEEKTRSKRHWRLNRFPVSTAASQWDLRVETADGLSKKTPLSKERRARSTSDLSHNKQYRKRNTSHLPSNDSGDSHTLLDKFFNQSTEALQYIRNSVRQKLQPSETVPGATATADN